MTEPTDVDHDVAVASRRRFLRDGGALMGGAVLTGGLAGSEALAPRTQPVPATSLRMFRSG
jgi:sulfane dehydrogenase subunit SoxC